MISIAQLKVFSDWLWSNDPFKSLFTDPMDLIVGLYISPITPSNLTVNSPVKVAGKDSGAQAQRVSYEYQYFSCGQLDISEYYGNFLDYECNVSIYLPYIGYKDLEIKEYMDGKILLDYLINFINGTCIAFLRSTRGVLNSVVAQYEGNIYSQIPLTSRDASSIIATTLQNAVNGGIGLVKHNPVMIANALASTASNVIAGNQNYERSGSLSLNAGYISVQRPYIIYTRPVQSISAGMRKDIGYMSNIYLKLGDLSGFTKILYIDLSGIECTDEERERLMDILMHGVYF